jgi:glycerol kinase
MDLYDGRHMKYYLLAVDQGTTNSRAIIFDRLGNIISQHEIPLRQSFPHQDWVEQDPLEMFNHSIECCRMALKKASLDASAIAAVGISNQRETTIIWDRTNGQPIYPAIVWQDRRTSEVCKQLSETHLAKKVTDKTGLLLNPYFSATKIQWILDHVEGARERAAKGELLFGTVDTFLLWKLTRGQSHATDVTNASRTMLFNIHDLKWDDELLQAFSIPANILPTVFDNTTHFGDMDKNLLGAEIPITGMAGDQQAAAFGQACFSAGMVKSTYGTGCFMLLNTGKKAVQSPNQLLTTIAFKINQEVAYGLEGSIFSAGSTIKFLRDRLKFISTAAETENIMNDTPRSEGVYVVPAFTGLGAPYWDPNARGAILGLTLNSSREQIIRAAMESVAYQTRDLLASMTMHGDKLTVLRVDGGMAVNNAFLQCLSDLVDLEIERPACIETTALGVAFLAGLQVGFYSSLEDIAKLWIRSASFSSQMLAPKRESDYQKWKQAVETVMTFSLPIQ